jgi:flagellar protein FliS
MQKKPVQAAYRRASLQNASSGELVAACFREARKALSQARTHIEGGTSASSYTALETVRRVYTHLYSTLDLDAGGQLAMDMQKLYAFVIEQTLHVASTYDLDTLTVLEKITDDMRDAWHAVSAPPVRENTSPGGSVAAQG